MFLLILFVLAFLFMLLLLQVIYLYRNKVSAKPFFVKPSRFTNGFFSSSRAKALLAQAGIRQQHAALLFYICKTVLMFLFGACASIYIYYNYDQINFLHVLFLFASIIIGLFLPDFWLRHKIKKRQRKIRAALPHISTVMLLCFSAGYSNQKTLKTVADNFSRDHPELADEFYLTAHELNLLSPKSLAWQHLIDRNQNDELSILATMLSDNETQGIPLLQNMRQYMHTLRKERLISAELLAAKLPAHLTLPLILFMVPPVFLIAFSVFYFQVGGMLAKLVW